MKTKMTLLVMAWALVTTPLSLNASPSRASGRGMIEPPEEEARP
jgi:hypothetical protein